MKRSVLYLSAKRIGFIFLSVAIVLSAIFFVGKSTAYAQSAGAEYAITVETDSTDVKSEKFVNVYDEKASKNYHSGTFEKDGTLKYEFIGTQIEVYGFKGSVGGSFIVSIDGNETGDVSCNGEKDEYRVLLGTFSNLGDGVHELAIRTTSEDAWVAIDYFKVYVGKDIYNNSRNLAQFGSIITSVPNPTGGGSKDLNIIRNEDLDEIIKNAGVVGGYNSEASQSYDSYTGSGPNRFYMGYSYSDEMYFSKLVFVEGAVYHDGGWFKNTPSVQVQVNGSWKEVEYISRPDFPADDSAEGHGYGIFVFTFKTIKGSGIRIIGDAGGSAYFVSVSQIEVYGNANTYAFAEGASYKNPVNYTMHEHVWKKTGETPATCTANAVEHMICDVCLSRVDKILENTAFGHTEVVDEGVAATCTEKGKTEGKHCSVCGAVLTEQKEISALGHTEVVDEGVAATCTEKGKTEGKHCSVCGAVLVGQKEIPALGHKYADEFECHDRHCVRCDFVCKATKEHSFDEGKITKKPTAKADGEKTFTCTICGITKVEPIAKLDNKGLVIGIVAGAVVIFAAGAAAFVIFMRRKKKQ